METFTAGRYGLKSVLIKQRGMCLRALEWPDVPCMEWLPAFGNTGVTFDAENDSPGPGSLQGHFEATQSQFLRLKVCLEAVVLEIDNRWIVPYNPFSPLLSRPTSMSSSQSR